MSPAPQNSNHGRLAVRLVLLVAVMLGGSFAAVPFYSWFCKVTGFGGTPSEVMQGADQVLDQTITVRFDANVTREFPWEFKPVQRTMEVRIGETALAFYEAHNPTDRPIAGSASYNVTPYAAGEFFAKIDCFCFTLQILQPGETVQMPVSFYVDPEIVDHPEAGRTRTITLSYTFYETDLPEEEDVSALPTNDATSNDAG